MSTVLRGLKLAVTLSTTGSAGIAAQGLPSELEEFLVQTVRLDRRELEAVRRGEAIVEVLEAADRLEVAVFGIVRVDVPRPFFIEGFDGGPDSTDPLRAEGRARRFSEPAAPADIAGFSLLPDDVEELRRCSPGACKVKLSADAIRDLRAGLDTAGRAGDDVVNELFRAHLADYVDAYRSGGDSVLIVYADRPDRASAAEVFAAMLSRSPYMYQYAPSLERYLRRYPHDRPAQVREALLWTEDGLPGLKSTLSITHRVVYSPPEMPGSTFIASKLLYANHYLDGALDLTTVVEQDARIFLVRLTRLHFDNLPGGPLNVRGQVTGGLRDRLAEWLRGAKTRNEQAYAALPRQRR